MAIKKTLQEKLRNLGKLFARKKEPAGYRSFDPQFRTSYGKKEAPKKRSGPFPVFSRLSLRRRKVQDEGYRRKEKREIPLLKIAAAVFLLGSAVLGYRVAAGWQGWRAMMPAVSIFQLRQVTFSGCSATREDMLARQAGLVLYQTNLLRLDLSEVEKKIAINPWVSSVTVERDWPSALVVRVSEHVPFALVNDQGEKKGLGLSYMDREGRIFFEVATGMDTDLPVITGLERIKEEGRRKEILDDILGFLRQTQKNDPNLPTQAVSEIHVNLDGELVVFLVEYPFPIFFGRGKAETKYNRLVKVLEVLYKKHENEMQISRVEYIRMDYLEDKVLVAQSGSG
ncbi:MAG: FtsQ-type POTRA domain-containing protein [Desulfobulbaceae bacterium]|nr:MAG: FtsQ-type POTRA domain-containing protein [Desulfobulbaceae bacterium]